jgi:hypothetical protein
VAINLVRTDDRRDAGTDAVVSMAIGRMIHYALHAKTRCRARSTMRGTYEEGEHRNRNKLITLTAVFAALAWTAVALGAGSGLERLYVLDCGQNTGKDQSRWSPGVNEGKAIEFSDNCYLLRHAKGLLLWDTGVPDAVAAMPDAMVVGNGAMQGKGACLG